VSHKEERNPMIFPPQRKERSLTPSFRYETIEKRKKEKKKRKPYHNIYRPLKKKNIFPKR
jgi:hypothetical protein